ncbi:hypothetical protein EV356DRAFT_327369 [Viridothelium virens]|uniref:Trichothecene 3-O-acetyltransferase-like N-terminal domain-containing protein n=1 Tax=Viridothelium virens TaxID=1048519 RepID=A0A6A6GY13_VIRVR|nr:hypothetical protein EV356DRAFT_327369 [Viridothelium virens]
MDDYLDIFGQQPHFNLYTQICLCFSLDESRPDSKIISTLKNGLERLTDHFPWVAGQVINEGSGEGNTGMFKIKPFEKTPHLIIKDFRQNHEFPSMAAFRQANFPFRMLDETIIAPCKTLPEPSTKSDPIPVLLIQANFITGGLLLTFVGQHQAMDMTGQANIMRHLSKACRKETFTGEEISCGNLSRHNVIPLLDYPDRQIPEIPHQIAPSTLSSSRASPSPKCVWTYFTFDAASLSALKSLATSICPSGYISTDDALSAFIWQSIIQARISRLDPEAKSTFARAVDPRRFLGISQLYCGLVSNMTYHTYTLRKLIDESLGVVASQLRSAIDPKTSDLEYRTRAFATALDRSPDKTKISITRGLDLSADIMLSSWSNLDSHELDFNLGLGKPEAVRRPQFDPVESLIYFMPKTLDGEIAVAICLRDEDMERLIADARFTRYGRNIK